MAPVVAVVAKAVAAVVAKVTFAAVAKFVVTTALSIGISKLIAKRAMSRAAAGGDGGGRVQLPPATDNKLPVIYGTAFIGGPITDAMLSTDQKTMWAVVALAEVTDNGTISFGDIYYDGKLVQFGSNGAVTGLITNNASPGSAQLDTRVNGYLNIYLYNNGSSNPTNSSFTAQQVLSIANGVPSGKDWDANDAMTNCAFAIIKVKYSTDAGTTGIGALTVQLKNTESGQTTGVYRPGTAIYDYMTNTRYGCAIPSARVDGTVSTGSIGALNTYSDEDIDYKPVGWNPGDPYSQQKRYRINGPLDTAQNCLTNLQFLVDSCDSWLQYSELTGLWTVVINKRYPGYPTETGLFLVDSSNLVGGIDISPIDLNETYNEVEVAYPNTNIKDQTDYQIIDLFADYPSVLSENEAVNRLNITLPLVNNAVQAKYIAARRIFQSREDLVITFKLDFSGIQVEAGDVIRVYYAPYGWDNAGGFTNGKLFRVSTVAEEKDAEGNLSAVIQAFEYNDSVYADDPVQDYVPSPNTGLLDPNVIDQPTTPTIVANPTAADGTSSFKVSSNVGANGLVLYMDYNFGNSSNVLTHRLYRTLQQSDGDPFAANTATNIDINDLPTGNYYFSVTARNNTSGKRSNSSAIFNWTGAIVPNVVVSGNICNANSVGNTITSDQFANIVIGANVTKVSGTGTLASNTVVTSINSNGSPTIFTVDPTPSVALNNACITFTTGGFSPNVYRPNTVPGNSIQTNTLPGTALIDYTVTSNKMSNTGVVAGNYTVTNLTVDSAGRITAASNGSASANILIKEDGINVVTTGTLNFTGTGVFVSNVSNTANISISAVGSYMQIADRQLQTHFGGGTPTNAWSTVLRDGMSLRVPGQLEWYNSGGTLTTQAYTLTANEYYPWFFNTSSTTNGFWANSLAQMVPIRAAYQQVSIPYSSGTSADGVEGWIIPYLNSPEGDFVNTANTRVFYCFFCDASVQVMSDANITIQIAGAVTFRYDANGLFDGRYVNYGTATTIDLIANKPYTYSYTWAEQGSRVSNGIGNSNLYVSSMGLALRNPSVGNLFIISSNSQVYLPTGNISIIST